MDPGAIAKGTIREIEKIDVGSSIDASVLLEKKGWRKRLKKPRIRRRRKQMLGRITGNIALMAEKRGEWRYFVAATCRSTVHCRRNEGKIKRRRKKAREEEEGKGGRRQKEDKKDQTHVATIQRKQTTTIVGTIMTSA